MAAPAAVIYRLGGKCSRFTAQVGVDDVDRRRGHGPLPGLRRRRDAVRQRQRDRHGARMAVDVSLIGKRRLKLLVTNADDGSALDRASWGDAKVECEP